MRGRRNNRGRSKPRQSSRQGSRGSQTSRDSSRASKPPQPGVSEPEFADSVGDTLEVAIERALDVLEAREDEVDVQVLQEGKRGFLGFGIKQPYRVRVSWREDSTEEILVDDEPSVPEPRSAVPPREPEEARVRRPARRASTGSSDEPRSRRRSRGERTHREARSAPTASSSPAITVEATSENMAATCKKLTEELLLHLGMSAEVTVRLEGEEIQIDISSDEDEALLIGRRGETLAALQHILHRMLSRRAGSTVPVKIDINQYWERRVQRLAEDARGMASEALRLGTTVETEMLLAQERRVIHRTLLNHRGIRTESTGRGLHKRVLVIPIEDTTNHESTT